jgi:hypothetical protein
VVPPPLLREPKLKRYDDEYLNAFYSLSHSRQPGGMGGVGPITVGEIRHYLDLVGIDSQSERVKYLRVMQRLDSVYLNDAAEKAKQQTKNKKP